jgi:hypothetical protein
MCLACEQDAIWFAYLESRGLLKPDDPAAVEALFSAFPVQPLPVQPEPAQAANPLAAPAKNPFSCDDPTAE